MSGEKILKACFGGIDLEKSYGKKAVLKQLTFAAPKSGIIGIFGLNGAGKTTLLKILSGLDGNFKGELFKSDFRDIAYMSVENYYPKEMRVKGIVDFFGRFLEHQQTDKIFRALQETGISAKSLFISLSAGQKQYVKFLLTIFSGASVCLFDEPLSNLDVNLRGKVVQTMIEEIDENRLFVITTHEIKEVERLIDGFYLLKEGTLSKFYVSEDVIAETGMSVQEFYKEKINEK